MNPDKDDLRPEYPEALIRAGVRGKFARRYLEGTKLALIEPDPHRVFPDSDAVNKALREYLSQTRATTDAG